MYIYTETGILVDRVDYQELSKEIGKPIAISENGLILIFKKGEQSEEISLVRVAINKLSKLKTIIIKDEIEKHLEISLKNKVPNADKMNEFWVNYLKKCKKMEKIEFNFRLNDNGDVLIRVKASNTRHQKK